MSTLFHQQGGNDALIIWFGAGVLADLGLVGERDDAWMQMNRLLGNPARLGRVRDLFESGSRLVGAHC